MSMLSPHVVRSRFFELTSEEWAVLGLGSLAFVAMVALMRTDVTLWPAMALFFTGLVFGHMCMTASRFVAFPDLIAVAACLQWVVAPWLADAYPPTLPMFRNSMAMDDYLRYALPATVVLWVGLHLAPSRYLDQKSWQPVLEPLTPRVRKALDGIIILGLLANNYSGAVPTSLTFLMYLLGSFRFFAALGYMVTETPGWRLRVGIVFALLLFEQATTGMFYLVVHWGGYFVLVYAFMRRWRWKLGMLVLTGLLMLGVLQQIKPAYRQQLDLIWGDSVGSAKLFTSMVWDRVRGVEQPEMIVDFGDTLVRFNQGWIISKVMLQVPKDEPYANGQTIIDAVTFSIVPRFLFPDKGFSVSDELFTKYTGVQLMRGTKMGLGIIGELYANFGAAGGILATFIYAIIIGAVFTAFAKRAILNPLWWAVGSIVILPAVEPGINIEDIMNHVVKGAIVLLILWKLMPPMQRLLAIPNQESDEETNDDAADYAPGFGDDFADHQVPRRL
jgi:hypothetical protein